MKNYSEVFFKFYSIVKGEIGLTATEDEVIIEANRRVGIMNNTNPELIMGDMLSVDIQEKLLNFIMINGYNGVTKTKISRKFQNIRGSNVAIALDTLAKLGKISVTRFSGRKDGGGMPKYTYIYRGDHETKPATVDL